jgi:TRAP-type C4-dicarboxylate transport system substrate-binding protein
MRYAVSLLLALLASPVHGQVILKLGTLAPQGSSWHEILKEMSQRWSTATSGGVVLRVYAGGVQGNEGDMIRKLGIGQLQAAALSNVGLHDVTPEPKALSIPLLFANEDEAECAFGRVRPSLEAALERRGFVVVSWSRLGALHLFCSSPRPSIADMATAKFYAQEGDQEAADAWRSAGFRPVQLSATDLYPSLQTGMIDCLPSLPLYVLPARLFERARYMNDQPWGYMYGATLVRRDAWEKVPADRRAALIGIARDTGARADAEVRRLNAEAIAAMRRQGLTVVPVDPGPWRARLEPVQRAARGVVIPAPFYDELVAARDGCRAAAARVQR